MSSDAPNRLLPLLILTLRVHWVAALAGLGCSRKFFEAGWIVSLDQGVAQSMTTWGDLLLENGGGKARPGPWSDPVISHIGWW